MPTVARSQTVPGFRRGHVPALDGLRAIAVLMVMVWHFHVPGWNGGFLGVDVFFVLSGFLITALLAEEWRATGTISLRRFYVRRALRLFPALTALLVINAPFVPLAATLVSAFYVANWAMVLGHNLYSPLSHLWSLSVEEHFYLLWPLMFVTLLRARTSKRWTLGLVALLAAASAAEKVLLWQRPNSWVRLYHATDTRADALLVGCGLGMLVAWGMLPGSARFRTGLRLAAMPAFLGFAYLAFTATMPAPFLYRGMGLTLVALAAGVLLLQILLAPVRLQSAILENRLMVGIGKISYGLYLWHHPVAWIPSQYLLDRWGPVIPFLLRVALSFLAARASYYLIEQPALRWKERFRAPGLVVGTAEGAAA